METKFGRQSFFDGGLLPLIGWTIVGVIITIFTLGIKLEDWKAKNTSFIN